MTYRYRTWYLGLIAGFYLVICAANVGYHVWRYFQVGSIIAARDFLPLLGALAAGAYFFRPAWGHKGLIALTILVILGLGESDPAATCFHLIVLGLLVLPFFKHRPKRIAKPALAA